MKLENPALTLELITASLILSPTKAEIPLEEQEIIPNDHRQDVGAIGKSRCAGGP